MIAVRRSLLYATPYFFVLCFPHKLRCQHARVLGWKTLFTLNARILAHPACCSSSHLLDSVNKEGFLHRLA